MKIIEEVITFDDLVENYHKTENVITSNDIMHNRTISYKIVLTILKERGIFKSGTIWKKKIDGEYCIVLVHYTKAIDKFDKYLEKANCLKLYGKKKL